MAPGLVSAGGHLPDPSKGDKSLDKGRPVAVMAQDKEAALSIGILKESTEEIRAKGKGVVVDNMHCLGGELYLFLLKEIKDISLMLLLQTTFGQLVQRVDFNNSHSRSQTKLKLKLKKQETRNKRNKTCIIFTIQQ